jgi:hypothetical protein
MNKNVVRLFDHKNSEFVLSEPDRITTAVTNVLAASANLGDAVKELSTSFDAIDHAIASIDNAETRSRLARSIKLSQETFSKALIHLTQEIGRSLGCRSV